ncbi:MAG: hypothetical protein AABX84_00445, partial [Nanoarchaeota archaeon]
MKKNKRQKNKCFSYDFLKKNRRGWISEGTPLRIAPDDKRGWIKIVEAFTSILLIAGTLIIIINSLGLEVPDSSVFVYDSEFAILKEIQLNNLLRDDILQTTIPAGEGEAQDIPPSIKDKIETRAPGYLKCKAKLCSINDICTITTAPHDKDIFVQSAFFGSNSVSYSPRKL